MVGVVPQRWQPYLWVLTLTCTKLVKMTQPLWLHRRIQLKDLELFTDWRFRESREASKSILCPEQQFDSNQLQWDSRGINMFITTGMKIFNRDTMNYTDMARKNMFCNWIWVALQGEKQHPCLGAPESHISAADEARCINRFPPPVPQPFLESFHLCIYMPLNSGYHVGWDFSKEPKGIKSKILMGFRHLTPLQVPTVVFA